MLAVILSMVNVVAIFCSILLLVFGFILILCKFASVVVFSSVGKLLVGAHDLDQIPHGHVVFVSAALDMV